MRDEEIKENIDSFSYGHFLFDLNGNLTKREPTARCGVRGTFSIRS